MALARITAALREGAGAATLEPAFMGGATPFQTLALAARIERGVVTLHDTALVGPAGGITAEGDIDLPSGTSDLRLMFRPAVPDPPMFGLRLSGPWLSPRRAPELAGLAAWRAAHPPAPPPPPPPPAATDPAVSPSARIP